MGAFGIKYRYNILYNGGDGMFGYIKPAYGELRVRENDLYRSAYCGLCRSMGKCTGCVSCLTLNYDLVFLALVRYALTGEKVQVRRGRCVAHPLKSHQYVANSDALVFTAGVSAVLTLGKIRDDIADEAGIRRMASKIVLPFAKYAAKRADVPVLEGMIADKLRALSVLEREKCDSIDKMAGVFGELLGEAVSFGLDGSAERIAREIGRYTGRFVYIIDAADDMGEDARRGRYNPFLAAYGTDVLEERVVFDHSGRGKKRTVPRKDVANGILTAARLDLMGLERAENLIDYGNSATDGMLRGIIGNIIGMGMPGEMIRVLGLVPERKNGQI